jgi:hypothetical protein
VQIDVDRHSTMDAVPEGYVPVVPELWQGKILTRWIHPALVSILGRPRSVRNSLGWILQQPNPGAASRTVYRKHRKAIQDRLDDPKRPLTSEEEASGLTEAGLEFASHLKPRPDVPGVFSFDCATQAFCDDVVAEIRSLEAFLSKAGIEIPTPNSMNRAGCVLFSTGVPHLGFRSLSCALVDTIVTPLSAALFQHDEHGFALHDAPPATGASATAASAAASAATDESSEPETIVDVASDGMLPASPFQREEFLAGVSHGPTRATLSRRCATAQSHVFIVKYKFGDEVKLNLHRDISDMTLNISLGIEFTGGTLKFLGWGQRFLTGSADEATRSRSKFFEHDHTVGTALLHSGRHPHKAEEITSGERWNLIVWRNFDDTIPGSTSPD